MENLLKDINAVSGVAGSFVCDDEGQILAKLLPDIVDEDMLSSVGRTMVQTIAGLKITRRRKVGDIDLLYDQGRLVVKPVRGGCLCILCARHINIPLVNLTANVAARKLAEIFKTKGEPVSREALIPSGPVINTVFLRKMEQELTREMGPIANLIIDEKVTALSEDMVSSPSEKAAELVERVGAEISNNEGRLRFQRIMQEALKDL